MGPNSQRRDWKLFFDPHSEPRQKTFKRLAQKGGQTVHRHPNEGKSVDKARSALAGAGRGVFADGLRGVVIGAAEQVCAANEGGRCAGTVGRRLARV